MRAPSTCNEALLGKAHAAKVVKTGQVRTDTTVVPADVKYPTDSGLLGALCPRVRRSS